MTTLNTAAVDEHHPSRLARELALELKRRRVDARLGLKAGSRQHPRANINIWTGGRPARFEVEISESKGYRWQIRGRDHEHALALGTETKSVATKIMQCFHHQCK